MKAVVFSGITECLTLSGALQNEGRLPTEDSLGVVRNAAVVVDADTQTIHWVGAEKDLPAEFQIFPWRDAKGEVWLPEFTECHTHLVHDGSRHQDYGRRASGMSYLEIAQAGGGIRSSVTWTRAASVASLIESGRRNLDAFSRFGVGCVEAKTGYGLSFESEMKLLECATALSGYQGIEVVPTFLPAHAVPPEFKGRKRDYVAEILKHWLPEVARKKAAEFFDVFIEEGFFSVDEARLMAETALSLGLKLKLHVDQFHALGGLELGIQLGATSCDHLDHSSEEARSRFARSRTVAVFLPGAALFTGETPSEVRSWIDAGARFALSTDFNPGTSPTHNLPLMTTFACGPMKMTIPEALVAITYGAAAALGREHERGVIAPGRPFRVVSAKLPSYEAIPYAYGEAAWERKTL